MRAVFWGRLGGLEFTSFGGVAGWMLWGTLKRGGLLALDVIIAGLGTSR